MTDTRRRILDATIALVREQGVRAVSFREVARRAGVSHQAPYHHFDHHQGILRAIAAEGFSRLADAMERAASTHEDPLEALVASGAAYVTFAADHVGHVRVMFDRAALEAGGLPPVPEGARARQVVETLAARAHAAGHAPGLPASTLADLCWATAHGLAVLLSERLLGPEDHLRPGDTSLPGRVLDALAGVLRAR
jgi:AcrR family transcriptional regulator